MELLFFCHNEKNIDAYRNVLSAIESEKVHIRLVVDDVRNILRDYEPDVLVSPANSHGYMDGGIDNVYRAIFPYVESNVKKAIASLGILSERGDPVLPVGSAMLVETGPTAYGPIHTRVLACVPTMFYPSVVRNVNQVYDAMFALLQLTQPGLVYAIPCLGTGVGSLDPALSAQEVRNAIMDWLNDKPANNHGPALYLSYRK